MAASIVASLDMPNRLKAAQNFFVAYARGFQISKNMLNEQSSAENLVERLDFRALSPQSWWRHSQELKNSSICFPIVNASKAHCPKAVVSFRYVRICRIPSAPSPLVISLINILLNCPALRSLLRRKTLGLLRVQGPLEGFHCSQWHL